jgi:hypothetical protein
MKDDHRNEGAGMVIKSRRFAAAFNLAAAVVALCGILLETGLIKGAFDLGKFLYFTVLSNVFCFFVFLWNVFRPVTGQGGMCMKGMAVMAITITMLVYWLLLAKVHLAMEEKPDPVANLMVHLIVPLLMIASWALFDPKGSIRVAYPLWWALAPFGYFVFVVIAAQLGVRYPEGGSYPYFFIDVTVLGWGQTLINVLLTAVGFIGLSFAYYGLDRWLGHMAARRDETR